MKSGFSNRPGRIVAGLLLASLFLGGAALPAEALSYRLIDANLPDCKGECGKIVVASGTIQQNEFESFLSFVTTQSRTHRLSRVLLIDSPGGFNYGAAGLGIAVRKLKMSVFVARPVDGVVTRESGLTSATCASACVLALAGGVTRHYTTGSRIGVHRAHNGGDVIDPVTRQIVSAKIKHDDVRSFYAQFFAKMGVSKGLSDLMDKTPSETMYWLSAAELAKYRLAKDSSKRR